MKIIVVRIVLLVLLTSWFGVARAAETRCVPLDFPSNAQFRNVTEPGDVHVLPGDRIILINKRVPSATRVYLGSASARDGEAVVIKDCGSAEHFTIEVFGIIEGDQAGKYSIDSNRASVGFHPVAGGWILL